MLESEVKFSPYEVLTELYEVEAVLQLVWSGRIDELALSFPHSTQAPARRYGADDYNQFEEDDSGDSHGAERKQKKNNPNAKVKLGRAPRKQERFEEDYDEYDFY